MKKNLGNAAILLLAVLMLFSGISCSKNESSSESGSDAVVASTTSSTTATDTAEPVTITFLHDWPEYEEQFNQIVADFEAANPDIKVQTTVITWDVLTKTLQLSFASGDAYDVACCWLDRVGGFNALGACYDFTDAMNADNGSWKNEFIGASLDLGTVDGKILGVPFRSTCTVLVYNKTMMEENGWTVPTNLEDFVALMEEAKNAGLIPLIAPGNPEGFQLASLTKTLAEHELYKSGKLTDSAYLSGRMSDVSEEYAKAGDTIKDWISKGYIDSDALALTAAEASAQFFTEKGLFYFANNNELASLQTNAADAGFELGFMAFPSPEGVPTLLYNYGVDGWMVYSGTKHPEEAIRFLKYLSSEEVLQKFGTETLSVMGNKNCVYDNEYQNQFVDIFTNSNSYRIKFDYNQGSLITDEALAIADFIADPDATGADLGKAIQELKQTCIDENAQ